MKKIILITLVSIFTASICFSQDIIIKKSLEDVQAKVIEVTTTEIKYKKFNNLNGPTYIILKSDVLMIRYENGTKDIFPESQNTSVVNTSSSDMKLKGKQYTITNYKGKNLFAQGAYININAGYGLSMSSLNFIDFYNYTEGINSSTDERVNVSLGKGLNVGGAFGYMFNKNIGAELGISYLLGGKSKAKDKYLGGKTDYTLSAKMLRINPSIVIASGLDGINPYAKFGLIVGSGSVMYEVNDNDGGDIEIIKIKWNGGLAFGLNAGVGALFNLSDKMAFFGEINMVNMSYAPTKGKVTEATYNGVDELPYMTTREKEAEFVDSYTYSSSNPPADSQPSKALKRKLPFGSFGINFGLRIGF